MPGDPFAPARRALLIGPALMLVGGGLIVLAIVSVGTGWWLLCVLGGVIALLGLLRLAGGIAVLSIEGRRKRILREGEPNTATVNSAKQLGTKAGYPIFEMGLKIRTPDGAESIVSKRGAIPPAFAGSLEPGTELPIKIRPSDQEFAIDWDAL